MDIRVAAYVRVRQAQTSKLTTGIASENRPRELRLMQKPKNGI